MKGRDIRIIYIAVVGGIGVLCCTSSYFFDYKPDAIHANHDRTRIHRYSFILNKPAQENEDIDSITNPNKYLI